MPSDFPTHRHNSEFWEALGRTVATFGFLEETLGKAIFAFTATRESPEEKTQAEFEKWLLTLPRMLSDPLGNLIVSYAKAVRDNSSSTITNSDDLVTELNKAAVIRNVICHGSWRSPDECGRSVPFFVNKQNQVFEMPIDIAYLNEVQRSVAELACNVVSTVMRMGWQFPGSAGPGKPIVEFQKK